MGCGQEVQRRRNEEDGEEEARYDRKKECWNVIIEQLVNNHSQSHRTMKWILVLCPPLNNL
jgi:hypothetical protein